MATGKPYLRKLKSGKVVVVKGRQTKGGANPLMSKSGGLKAGLKFNAAGQVVKDKNRSRAKNRARKQAGKAPATAAKKPRVAGAKKKGSGKKK